MSGAEHSRKASCPYLYRVDTVSMSSLYRMLRHHRVDLYFMYTFIFLVLELFETREYRLQRLVSLGECLITSGPQNSFPVHAYVLEALVLYFAKCSKRCSCRRMFQMRDPGMAHLKVDESLK